MNKDKNNNGNGKDKNNSWNKNKNIVNNGVVDVPNTKEPTFYLDNAILSTKKQKETRPNNSKKSHMYDKPKFTKSSKPRHRFTPLMDLYDVILNTLLSKKLITLPEKSRPYDLIVNSSWWKMITFLIIIKTRVIIHTIILSLRM